MIPIIVIGVLLVMAVTLVCSVAWSVFHNRIYKVAFDDYQTTAELLQAAQFPRIDFIIKYHYAYENRYWYSGIKTSRVVGMKPFHFNERIAEKDAKEYMAGHGFSPANLRELLFFQKQFSNECRGKNIVALGAIEWWPALFEDDYIVQISRNGDLDTYCPQKFVGGSFSDYYLAVRNPKPSLIQRLRAPYRKK